MIICLFKMEQGGSLGCVRVVHQGVDHIVDLFLNDCQ